MRKLPIELEKDSWKKMYLWVDMRSHNTNQVKGEILQDINEAS